jgi:hypothetical protein
MGWGRHPSTLTMNYALAVADRSGHPRGSLGWHVAYRDAYAGAAYAGEPGLAEYLAGLDARIEATRRAEAAPTPP